MANFFWVGGSTTGTSPAGYVRYTNPLGNFTGKTGAANMDWVLAFDWNNPNNWIESSPSTRGPALATRCPSIGDNAYFGYPVDLAGSPIYENAKAPCLWGGATQAGATVTWVSGASTTLLETIDATGTTYDSSLGNIYIYSFGSVSDGSGSTAQYKFNFIGGNVDDLAQYSGGIDYYWNSALYDAQKKGFTLDSSIWGGAAWEDLAAAVAATGAVEKFRQLRFKVDNIVSDEIYGNVGTRSFTQDDWSKVSITSMKNLKRLNGSSAGSAGDYHNTIASLVGSPEYYLKGYWTNINRVCPTVDAWTFPGNQTRYAPRPHLSLVGCTAGKVSVSQGIGSVLVDSSSRLSEMVVQPTYRDLFLQLQNKFLRTEVLGDIGSTFSAGTAAGTIPNLTVTSPYYLGAWNLNSMIFKGILIGESSPTSSFVADWVKIGDATNGNTGVESSRLKIMFGGTAAVTRMETSRADIGAWSQGGIDPNSTVSVDELKMYSGSLLNLADASYFDSWKFGKQVGYQINGGILMIETATGIMGSTFGTSFSRVRGSQNVRLWNDPYLVNGGNFVEGGSKGEGNKQPAKPTAPNEAV